MPASAFRLRDCDPQSRCGRYLSCCFLELVDDRHVIVAGTAVEEREDVLALRTVADFACCGIFSQHPNAFQAFRQLDSMSSKRLRRGGRRGGVSIGARKETK